MSKEKENIGYKLFKVKKSHPGKFDYYGAAEPPVRCGVSHLSGPTEPPDYYKLL